MPLPQLTRAAAAIAIAATLAAAPAAGQDSTDAAIQLGSLLASEEPCGLAYDQAAIGAWVEANVPADDMDFPSTLGLMTRGAGRDVAAMSPSALTANCASVTRAARHFGFVD